MKNEFKTLTFDVDDVSMIRDSYGRIYLVTISFEKILNAIENYIKKNDKLKP
jgi:deoxyhypusine synthase